jgi:hypothetical protein
VAWMHLAGYLVGLMKVHITRDLFHQSAIRSTPIFMCNICS